jgi:hypothetical protein
MTDALRQDHRNDDRIERRDWVVPAVRSLRAGAAEDGFGTNADGGQDS